MFDPAKCNWDYQDPPIGSPCNNPVSGYDENPELNVMSAELEYPRIKGKKNAVRVGMMDVRAADGLLIVFDFERNGWSIMRDISAIDKTDGHYVCTLARNVEVCFLPADTEVEVDDYRP